MKKTHINAIRLPFLALFFFGALNSISCNGKKKKVNDSVAKKISIEENKEQLVATMQKHLNAVTNRDLEALITTMSPKGNMQLILPGTEIIFKVDGFMDYHADWFESLDWTFETKILNTEVGDTMGMAVAEVIYREPERDGKPYFNRMIVSYDLQKIDGKWYVVKDHASSVEKSTDLEN